MKWLFRLPAFVHDTILALTGYRIVEITEEGKSTVYEWSDHYPL